MRGMKGIEQEARGWKQYLPSVPISDGAITRRKNASAAVGRPPFGHRTVR